MVISHFEFQNIWEQFFIESNTLKSSFDRFAFQSKNQKMTRELWLLIRSYLVWFLSSTLFQRWQWNTHSLSEPYLLDRHIFGWNFSPRCVQMHLSCKNTKRIFHQKNCFWTLFDGIVNRIRCHQANNFFGMFWYIYNNNSAKDKRRICFLENQNETGRKTMYSIPANNTNNQPNK